MNCCEFGECKQGHGCPVRENTIEPEENLPWAWIDRLGFWWACVIVGFACGIGYGIAALAKRLSF